MNKQHSIRATKIALFVGTILNLINSYDSFVTGAWNYKILLTYCVPFFVSIYSSWQTSKVK